MTCHSSETLEYMVTAGVILRGLFICYTQLLRSSQVQDSKAQETIIPEEQCPFVGPITQLPAPSSQLIQLLGFSSAGGSAPWAQLCSTNSQGSSWQCTHRPGNPPVTERTERGSQEGKEGLEPAAGGAARLPHPSLREREGFLGTGFLVNSAATKNTLALDRHPGAPLVSSSTFKGLSLLPERSRGWEESSLVKNRISLRERV